MAGMYDFEYGGYGIPQQDPRKRAVNQAVAGAQFTPQQTFNNTQIQNAYQQYLGRQGSPEEIAAHLHGGRAGYDQVRGSISNIMNSPEAAAYRERGAMGLMPNETRAPGPSQGGMAPTTGTASGRLDQQANRGFTGWGKYANQMGGFDLNRYQRDIISAGPNHPEYKAKKITVAQLASGIDPTAPDAVQQLVNQLRSQGEQVEFDGLDRIRFADAPQDGWIDVLQNKQRLKTGSGPLAWQWLDNHGSGPGGGGGGGAHGAAMAGALGGFGGSGLLANGYAPVPASTSWLKELLASLGVNI